MTFFKYLTIQVLAYGIDMGVFLLLLHLDGPGPIVANVVSKMAAGCFAFVSHRSFTFGVASSGLVRRQAMRYFFVLAINVPTASAILGMILIWLPLPVVAKFLADVVCVALSYLLSKHFIFNVHTTSSDNSVSGVEV